MAIALPGLIKFEQARLGGPKPGRMKYLFQG
jgi:hypothetical protein